MAWTAPRTWTTGELVTAPIMNAHVRDNLLETASAKVTTAGDIVYATGANALGRVAIGSIGRILRTDGSVPGWTNDILIAANGEVTKPRQPCFLALNNADDVTDGVNKTGNGTNYTVPFHNEITDLNADYDAATTFTAPVAGQYAFAAAVEFENITATSYGLLRVVTTARSYYSYFPIVNGAAAQSGLISVKDAPMAASDTAVISLTIYGQGGDSIDVSQVAGYSFFSGHLVA